MKALKLFFQTRDDVAPVLMRLGLAVVMFPHGAQKVLGWFGGYGFSGTMKFFTENLHIPAPIAVLAILAEFLGPIGLLLGLGTRLAAFGIGATITVAALMAHTANGFFMNWSGQQAGEGFEYHILMAVLAFAIVIQGAGKWALDSLVLKKLAAKN
jgi:putative oxidoreductase